MNASAPVNHSSPVDYPVAQRMRTTTSSAIRDLLQLATRPGMISFAGGLPAAELFDVEGMRAATEAVMREEPRQALQYGVTDGQMVLRSELARLTGSRGAHVEPEQVVVTTGSQQGIDLVARVMLDAGDTVVVERPSYLAAIQAFGLAQARFATVPVDNHGIDVNALANLLEHERPKFIYVIANFANPSGATLTRERRIKLLELAVRHRVFVLEDDPYGELRVRGKAVPPLIALAEHVPGARAWCGYLSTLSKIVAPGFRLGWLVLPESLHHYVTIAKQGLDLHTSTFAQLIAARYLASNRLEERWPVIRSTYRERNEAMTAALDHYLAGALSYNAPDGGMFLWARMTEGTDTQGLLVRAIEENVIFVPGAPFFAQAPEHDTLRISFATCNPERIVEGVQRLARALDATRAEKARGVIDLPL
jgi:2-aminoadipate transaminase